MTSHAHPATTATPSGRTPPTMTTPTDVPAATAAAMVAEFSRATGGDHRPYPQWADLRKRLLREELAEVIDAIDRGEPHHLARELADLVYVAYGTAITPGIDLDAALREVHRANMSKLGTDGRPITRADGKVLKGPHFTPPDMTAAVTRGAVRAALVDLLTTGQHHHAATEATLTAVGDARAALAGQHGSADPAASCAAPEWRLTTLIVALGFISSALFNTTEWQPPDTAQLRTGLTELAAITLGWLDALAKPPRRIPVPGDPDDDLAF
jgi:NTP pyrophosphatase (non-canonical NTP hydrolase)